MDFPTRNDYFLIGRNWILSLNARLSAAAAEREGTDLNILLGIASSMADAVTGQLMLVCAGQFLDSSEDLALDRYCFDRYGLVRKPAAPGFTRLTFTTTAAVTTAFTIPAGTLVQSSEGIQYLTLYATAFPAGSSGPIYVAARSLLAGLNQQVKIGQLTNITSQITDAPSDLVCTNEAASAGAADREADPELRDRARRFWTTARRGTLAAIEAGALAVPGVLRSKAIESVDAVGRQGRWVYLVVADRFTDALVTLNQTSATYETQSRVLAEQVFRLLDDVRCGGIFVEVQVAQVVLLPVRLDLSFSAGVDLDDVANRARAAVATYTNTLDPAETWEPADALDALRRVSGLIITGNEIASPVGSVQPRAAQVIRTTFDLVAATVGGGPIPMTTNPDLLVSAGFASSAGFMTAS